MGSDESLDVHLELRFFRIFWDGGRVSVLLGVARGPSVGTGDAGDLGKVGRRALGQGRVAALHQERPVVDDARPAWGSGKHRSPWCCSIIMWKL